MKRIILPKSFFDRPTLVVARDLLGKYIVRRISAVPDKSARELVLMITEVEAYDGPNDLASHASRKRYVKNIASGKTNGTPKAPTGRAAIMFGPAGYFYMFFTYGMHWMANVVVGPKNYPSAILLRGGSYENSETGALVRVNGPARLTKFLEIDGSFNGKVAAGRSAARTTGLWFEDRGVKISRSKIIATRRVGVEYAGPIWAEKEWNFKIKPEV